MAAVQDKLPGMRKPVAKEAKGTNAPNEASGANAGEIPCPFCQIVARETPAYIVFEDDISLAFLDHRPLFAGHCLLITRKHYPTLYDLPGDLIGPIFANARKLAQAVQTAMQADGTFVAINTVVSQSVPHFHIHIVPRKRGDGLRGFFWPRHKATEEELRAVQQTIVAALGQHR
jgi:histidine triad (HIT) family protein